MGEVYRARDLRLGREVAVKVLPEHLSRDADALARFEREARAIAALSHPNLLAIYDFGADGGVSFAVTELLHGETLRAALAGGGAALAPRGGRGRRARRRARGRALARDRSPRPEARQRLPDVRRPREDPRLRPRALGTRRRRQAIRRRRRRLRTRRDPGTVLGTVGYMSPEQVRGEPTTARERPLRVRVRAPRDADGPPGVHGRDRVRADGRDPPRRAAAALAADARTCRRSSTGSSRRCLEKSAARRPGLRGGARARAPRSRVRAARPIRRSRRAVSAAPARVKRGSAREVARGPSVRQSRGGSRRSST